MVLPQPATASHSTQPATVVMQNLRHADQTHAYLPTCFALTLSYTLIPTIYRAVLTSAVSGIGLWIHTTMKKAREELKKQ